MTQRADTMDPQTPNEPVAQAPEQNDLSGKTILMLVVLTLIISFIGAWASISQVMSFAQPHAAAPQPVSGPGSAQVNFVIEGPPQPQTSTGTGMVAFEILKR